MTQGRFASPEQNSPAMNSVSGKLISCAFRGNSRDWRVSVKEMDGMAQMNEGRTACWVRWRNGAGKKAGKRERACRGG